MMQRKHPGEAMTGAPGALPSEAIRTVTPSLRERPASRSRMRAVAAPAARLGRPRVSKSRGPPAPRSLSTIGVTRAETHRPSRKSQSTITPSQASSL
jgi:hypothetical protein